MTLFIRGVGQQQDAGQQQREAQYLAHSHPTEKQVTQLRIGQAEKFHPDAAQGIEHGEQARYRAQRTRFAGIYP